MKVIIGGLLQRTELAWQISFGGKNGELKVSGSVICFPVLSGLWVLRECLMEVQPGINYEVGRKFGREKSL